MSTKVLTCPNCKSRNITSINGDLKDTVNKPIVNIKAKCDDCNFDFEYPSATKYGRRRCILY